jgi:HK97 family phage major capsid protein/HK97 family phage prohead protease
MAETVVKEKEIFQRWIPNVDIRFEKRGEVEVMTFPASSEYPVERWYGTEVLSHAKGAVRMDRAKQGAMPLLFNHNTDDPRGMIVDGRLDGNRFMVDATFFANERGKDLRAMIEGGLRNVSLAYRINVVEENTKDERFTVTDWEPYEVSIVSVPADPTVGIGRTAEEYAVRMITHSGKIPSRDKQSTISPPTITRSAIMTPEEEATQREEARKKAAAITATEAENQRCEAIRNLCKSNRIDSRVEDRWIFDGTPLTEVAEEMLKVMEVRGKQKPAVASELGLSKGETKKYSLFRAIRALNARNDHSMNEAAAFEFECSRAVAKQIGREGSGSLFVPAEVLMRPLGADAVKRTMTTIPGSKGGYMVDVENLGFIDILRNRSCAMAMGARVLSGLQGNVLFPRQTGKVTVTWQAGEGVTVAAADQTLGQLSMTPKTCIAITDISEQLLRQSSPSAESFVMADLAADVAIDGVDNAVLNGAGGNQPLGIKNTTGITSGQDAASATYAKILQFPITAGGVNAIRGNPGWVTNTAGAGRLVQVQRFTSTDTPLWVGNLLNGLLVGFNAMSTEQVAANGLIFGSWDEVVIGEWGVLELKTDSGGTRFNAGLVGVRALWMVDVLVRYPQAFVVSSNLS